MRAFSRLALDLVAIQSGLFSMGLFSRKLNKNFFFKILKRIKSKKSEDKVFMCCKQILKKWKQNKTFPPYLKKHINIRINLDFFEQYWM